MPVSLVFSQSTYDLQCVFLVFDSARTDWVVSVSQPDAQCLESPAFGEQLSKVISGPTALRGASLDTPDWVASSQNANTTGSVAGDELLNSNALVFYESKTVAGA